MSKTKSSTHLTIPKYQSSQDQSNANGDGKDDEGREDVADDGDGLLAGDSVAVVPPRYHFTDVHEARQRFRSSTTADYITASFEKRSRPVQLQRIIARAVRLARELSPMRFCPSTARRPVITAIVIGPVEVVGIGRRSWRCEVLSGSRPHGRGGRRRRLDWHWLDDRRSSRGRRRVYLHFLFDRKFCRRRRSRRRRCRARRGGGIIAGVEHGRGVVELHYGQHVVLGLVRQISRAHLRRPFRAPAHRFHGRRHCRASSAASYRRSRGTTATSERCGGRCLFRKLGRRHPVSRYDRGTDLGLSCTTGSVHLLHFRGIEHPAQRGRGQFLLRRRICRRFRCSSSTTRRTSYRRRR